MQLSEDLGPLADLKAGNLINVFKQHNRGGEDQNKFTQQWGNRIGQNSPIVDIGAISGWKDIRKVLKPGDGTYVGFVLYADGKAFGSVALYGSTLSKPKNDDIMVAFDPAGLPAEAVASKDTTQRKWDYQKGQNTEEPYNSIRDRATRKEITRSGDWETDESGRQFRKQISTGKFRTGVSTTPDQLYKYVDEIVELCSVSGATVTCKLIGRDQEGADKRQQRYANTGSGGYTDELEKREAEAQGKSGWNRRSSLNTALDKYKASKNMNTFDSDEEAADFLSDSNNFGQTFVYKGRQYKFVIDDYNKSQKFDVARLITGEPVEFRVSFPATNKEGYNSMYVTYRLGAGGCHVSKIGY